VVVIENSSRLNVKRFAMRLRFWAVVVIVAAAIRGSNFKQKTGITIIIWSPLPSLRQPRRPARSTPCPNFFDKSAHIYLSVENLRC
jgi:hypothetical protein